MILLAFVPGSARPPLLALGLLLGGVSGLHALRLVDLPLGALTAALAVEVVLAASGGVGAVSVLVSVPVPIPVVVVVVVLAGPLWTVGIPVPVRVPIAGPVLPPVTALAFLFGPAG